MYHLSVSSKNEKATLLVSFFENPRKRICLKWFFCVVVFILPNVNV